MKKKDYKYKGIRHILTAFTIIGLLGLQSCRKDVYEESEVVTTTISTTTTIGLIDGNMKGVILDEQLQAVPNAEITIYDKTTSSDENGVYTFDEVSINPLGTYIQVSKDGYYLGSDLVVPAGKSFFSKVILKKKEKAGEFNTNSGGEINIIGGGTVRFSANSIADEFGKPYSGTVEVFAKNIDLNQYNAYDKMPGGLTGIAKSGHSVVLSTLSMVDVELFDTESNVLNLRNGATASISFPLTDPILANAPNTVPLWYFDEIQGLWIEEGEATLDQGMYLAKVSHFTTWNCDIPENFVKLCGRVQYANGEAVKYSKIVVSKDNFGNGSSYTNTNGEFCLLVPRNSELQLIVVDDFCEEIILEEDIVTLESDIMMDDMTVTSSMQNISGQVFCGPDVLSHGYVVIEQNEHYQYAFTDTNGNFDYSIVESNCIDSEFLLTAYDLDTDNSSVTQEYAFADIPSPLNFDVCVGCEHSVNVVLLVKDACVETEYFLIAKVSNGSGEYLYDWSNGEQSDTTTNLISGNYCVTVTDVVFDCQKVACFDASIPEMLALDASISNPACDMDNGQVSLLATGGKMPYTYQIDGPGGNKIGQTHNELAAGTYVGQVKDANDCVAFFSFELVNQDLLTGTFSGYLLCGPESILSIEIENGVEPFEYAWSTGSEDPEIVVNTVAEYCVEVTDALGCVYADCIEVKEKNIVVAFLNETDCESVGILSANATGGEAPYFYEWGNGSIQPFLEVNEVGTYCLTITDADNCQVTDCFKLVNESLVAEMYGATLCDGEGTVGVTIIEGTGPFNFFWNNGEDSQEIEPGEAGIYCVTVSDFSGCSYEECIDIGNDQVLIIPYCEVGYYIETNGQIITQNGGTTEDLINGNFVMTVEIEYGSGCIKNETIFLPYFEGLEVINVNDTSCGTCEDGFIEYNFEIDANCAGCEVNNESQIFVYLEGEYDNNLVSLNESQSLPAGTYYVGVQGLEGCIIYSEKAIIE